VLVRIEDVLFNISYLGSVKDFREDAVECEKQGMKYLYVELKP